MEALHNRASKMHEAGTLFTNKYKSTICYNSNEPQKRYVSKRNETQKTTYCMIPFI